MGLQPIAPPPRRAPRLDLRERIIEHLEKEYVDGAITLEELDARVGEALEGDPALVKIVEPLQDFQIFVDPADHPEWWRWSESSHEWVPVKEIG